MKKILKDIILLTIIVIYFIYSLTYSTYIKTQIVSSFNLWLTNIIPSLFPTFIIIDLIYSTHLPYYINKYLHFNISYLLSIISGSPSNAIMLMKEETPDKTISLAVTKYISLLFLYNNLKDIFNIKITLILIICNILSNLSLIFFLKPPSIPYSKNNTHLSFLSNIKNHMLTLLNILGTIIFFNTLPIFLIKSPFLKLFINSILEITTFFNYLKISTIPLNIKLLFTIIAISTCGLCIESQIKSIIPDTSINYKRYIFYRLLHLTIYMLLVYLMVSIL